MLATRLKWVNITPFGVPESPLEVNQYHEHVKLLNYMHLEIFISLFTTALTVAPTSQIVGPTYFRTIVLPYTTYLLLLSIGNFVGSLPLSRKK